MSAAEVAYLFLPEIQTLRVSLAIPVDDTQQVTPTQLMTRTRT